MALSIGSRCRGVSLLLSAFGTGRGLSECTSGLCFVCLFSFVLFFCVVFCLCIFCLCSLFCVSDLLVLCLSSELGGGDRRNSFFGLYRMTFSMVYFFFVIMCISFFGTFLCIFCHCFMSLLFPGFFLFSSFSF